MWRQEKRAMERNIRHHQKNYWTWVNIRQWPYLYHNRQHVAISIDMDEIKHTLIYMPSKTKQHLAPEYRKLNKAWLVSKRTRHTVTFNPHTVAPSEQLYIRVLRLSKSDRLILESLHSCFNLKVSTTNNHLKNNLPKLFGNHICRQSHLQKTSKTSG